MAEITFFEITGCINNTKQKNTLASAWLKVKPIDLLKHKWTEDELLLCNSACEVKDWFNRNAPSVQNGTLAPEDLNRISALEAIIKDHLRIHLPLLIIRNKTLVGFDINSINSMAGLDTIDNLEIKFLLTENLEDCSQKKIKNSMLLKRINAC